jgi:G6PDH family F420-dependent oxidoreductase
MTEFGSTMMCEQSPPDALVDDIRRAEEASFDFSAISDHFQPWLVEQGHSPYAWSVLGTAAAVTERIGLMTYVTCPTVRYHPAIVAQKAATMQILSGGRFRLGLGAGENLNEHVIGDGWPAVGTPHSMLSEALDVIDALFDSGEEAVSLHGEFFDLETARLWDLPEQRRRVDPLWPRRRRARGEDQALHRRRLHRDRAAADRRLRAGEVHGLGRARVATGAARGRDLGLERRWPGDFCS